MRKLFLASLALTAFACSILVFQMTSCKKATAQVVTKTDTIYKCNSTFKGLWEGTYLTNQVTHAPTFASFTFYSNGSLLFKASGVAPAQNTIYAVGRWSLNNNVISFTDTTINYTSVVIQSGTFNYDSNQSTLSGGTWRNVSGDNGAFYTGTYASMTKIQ